MTDYRPSILSTTIPNSHVGIFSAAGGLVTFGALASDFLLPAPYSIIHCGIGGDIFFEGMDGNVIPFFNTLSADRILVCARKVLASAIVDGNPYSTTCQKITWHHPANIIQI